MWKRLLPVLSLIWGVTAGLSSPLPVQAQIAELPVNTAPSPENLAPLLAQTEAHWQQVKASRRAVDSARIEKLLQQARQALNDSSQSKTAAQQLLEAQILMMPSRPVEMRGALLDANLMAADPAAMARWLDRLQAAGFNAVFPEVFRRGFALFPNRVVELDTRYAAKQVDALKVISQLAKERGIQVYPWFWVFRIYSEGAGGDNPVAGHLPALISPQLKPVAPSEGLEDESAAFVSPASSEWRQLMATLMADVARTYPVDGFLLDYIRYGNGATEDQLSKTRFQLEYFQKVGSFPPRQPAPGTELNNQWHLWRENQVHQMVQTLQLALADVKPGLGLGAAVFRNEVNARTTKMQHWRHWSNNNWINFVAPMLYTTSPEQLAMWLDWESDNSQRQDLLYPILGLQSMRTPGALFAQLELLQQRQAGGAMLFALSQLNDSTLTRLKQGPFRNPALVPHKDLKLALQTQLQASASWLQSLSDLPAAQALAGTWQQQAQALGAVASWTPALDKLEQRLQEASLPEAVRREARDQLSQAQALARVAQFHDPNGRKLMASTPPPTAVQPQALPLPSLSSAQLPAEPLIDGELDEPIWQQARSLNDFWWSTGSQRPQVKTQLRVGHTAEALYLAFNNDEPRMDRLKAEYRVDNNEQLVFLGDDTLEVFLGPANDAKAYHYYALNAINTRFHKASGGAKGSGEWQSAAVRLNSSWQAELRIPFSSLGLSGPGPLRANFCRRRPQEINPYHCWSMTFGGVHRPDRFGQLNLPPVSNSPDPEISPQP